eukprot:jgi/Bigna1/75072/fgenesh1_pg.32_\
MRFKLQRRSYSVFRATTVAIIHCDIRLAGFLPTFQTGDSAETCRRHSFVHSYSSTRTRNFFGMLGWRSVLRVRAGTEHRILPWRSGLRFMRIREKSDLSSSAAGFPHKSRTMTKRSSVTSGGMLNMPALRSTAPSSSTYCPVTSSTFRSHRGRRGLSSSSGASSPGTVNKSGTRERSSSQSLLTKLLSILGISKPDNIDSLLEEHEKNERRSTAGPVSALEMFRSLKGYVWPEKGGREIKIRVVPFLFKHIVDGLAHDHDVTSTMLAEVPEITVPVALILGYGIGRSTATVFGEAKNAVFAVVAQKANRKILRRVFEHLQRSAESGAILKQIALGVC